MTRFPGAYKIGNVLFILIELIVTSEMYSFPPHWTITVASLKYNSNQSLKMAGGWNCHITYHFALKVFLPKYWLRIKTGWPRAETITGPGSGLVVVVVISLAVNITDRNGQVQDREGVSNTSIIHKTKLCLYRETVSVAKYFIERD